MGTPISAMGSIGSTFRSFQETRGVEADEGGGGGGGGHGCTPDVVSERTAMALSVDLDSCSEFFFFFFSRRMVNETEENCTI